MVYIYVLQLENNKYYVGKTSTPDFRLEAHFNNNGSAWTKKYKPIKLHELIPDCDDYDEDKYTKIYMDKYGINNVRGGSYVQIILNDATIKYLNRITNSTNNLCFNCGSSNHFIKDCKIKNNVESIQNIQNLDIQNTETQNTELPNTINKVICNRCNRRGHTEINCFAKTNKNGEPLINNIKDTESIQKSDTQSSDIQNVKINTYTSKTLICNRCNRKGHTDISCFAKINKNGEPLIDNIKYVEIIPNSDTQSSDAQSVKINTSTPNTIICNRCNRKGHTEINCFAKINKNGESLIDNNSCEEHNNKKNTEIKQKSNNNIGNKSNCILM